MRRKEWEKTGTVKRKRGDYIEQHDNDKKEPELTRKSKRIRIKNDDQEEGNQSPKEREIVRLAGTENQKGEDETEPKGKNCHQQ